MADIRSRRITRDKLAKIFKDHELVKAFENLTQDVIVTLPGMNSDALAIAIEAQSRGALMRMPEQRGVRGRNGVLVLQDAGGNIVELDMEFVINAVRAYLPRAPRALVVRPGANVTVTQDAAGFTVAADGTVPNDMQNILANRIFTR